MTEVGLLILILALTAAGLWAVLQRVRLLEQRLSQLPSEVHLTNAIEQVKNLLDPVHADLIVCKTLTAQTDSRMKQLAKLQDQLLQEPKVQPLITEDLSPLNKKVEGLQAQLEGLSVLVKALQTQVMSVPNVSAKKEDVSLLARLKSMLESDGWADIRVVGDLGQLDSLDELRFPIEARRRGTVHKGVLTVEEGRISDVDLKPSYGTFP